MSMPISKVPLGKLDRKGEYRDISTKSIFHWTLAAFSSLEGWCVSPSFSFGGRSWSLRLFLNYQKNNPSGGDVMLSVFLHDPPLTVRYSVGIITAEGNREGVYYSGTQTIGSFIYDRVRVMERSKLLQRSDELLPLDTLIISLDLELEGGSSETVLQNGSAQAAVDSNVAVPSVQATVERNIGNESVRATVQRNVADASVQTAVEESVSCGRKGAPSESTVSFDPNLESLSLDFSKLLEDQVLSDVKLKCAERTFCVHRAVLAARSEVFIALFRNDTVESETSVIDVKDVEAPVLDLFLRYVYTGKLQGMPEDLVPGVYAACEKYAVHSLKKACSDLMIAGLTEGNCVRFLTVADAHNDASFREQVVSFICGHEAILQSEAWASFRKNHKDLAIEVYDSYFRRKSRASVDSAPSFSGDGAEDELAQPMKRRKF